jgi:hypothetical protein
VLARDDDVDRRYARILSDMAAHMRKQPEDAEAALRIIRVAHCLERVADHATNIAEETIFAVRGVTSDTRRSGVVVLTPVSAFLDRAPGPRALRARPRAVDSQVCASSPWRAAISYPGPAA